jgi:hypothetical protein
MTTTIHNQTSEQHGSSRAGAIGGLIAAASFIFGIALLVTTLSDYTEGDPTAAESVEFQLANQSTLYVWYLVIYLVFGVAIIPLARSLHQRLAGVSPQLADIGAVFAYIWAGLMFATGMTSNIAMAAVADLHETDPAAAEALWSSLATVNDGLGGGNELVGGMWILLVSLAAWGTKRLPRGLNVLGIISAVAGLITLIPGLSDVGIIFGLGSIAWFAWVGIVLLRHPTDTAPVAEVAR